jgi:hypothetical protein
MRKLAIALAAIVLSLLSVGGGTALATGTGSGSGFLLGGTAQNSQDPQNPANDVVRVSTLDDPFFGTVGRSLNVKIPALDNQLEWKQYLVSPKTCIGGSPRMQLAIDLNGDGTSDGNAFGYFGTAPFGTGCASDTWEYGDMTDTVLRWDVTQLAGLNISPFNPFTVPWDAMELAISTQFPNHLVCTGQLTDDTFGIPGMSGIAYYDLISIGNSTWSNRRNTAGRGFAHGCGRPDNGDGHGDKGDKDKDDDTDNGDDQFDKNRHKHWG